MQKSLSVPASHTQWMVDEGCERAMSCVTSQNFRMGPLNNKSPLLENGGLSNRELKRKPTFLERARSSVYNFSSSIMRLDRHDEISENDDEYDEEYALD